LDYHMIIKETELVDDQLTILRWLYTYTLRDLEIAPYILENGYQPIQHNVVDNNKFGIQILSEGFDEEEVVRNSKDEDLAIVFFVNPSKADSSSCFVEGRCVDDRLDEYFQKLWDSLLSNFIK